MTDNIEERLKELGLKEVDVERELRELKWKSKHADRNTLIVEKTIEEK
jgi:hypothetical protein